MCGGGGASKRGHQARRRPSWASWTAAARCRPQCGSGLATRSCLPLASALRMPWPQCPPTYKRRVGIVSVRTSARRRLLDSPSAEVVAYRGCGCLPSMSTEARLACIARQAHAASLAIHHCNAEKMQKCISIAMMDGKGSSMSLSCNAPPGTCCVPDLRATPTLRHARGIMPCPAAHAAHVQWTGCKSCRKRTQVHFLLCSEVPRPGLADLAGVWQRGGLLGTGTLQNNLMSRLPYVYRGMYMFT